jgi:hypothetical protein
MQKVEGSNPFSRLEKTCKSALSTSRTGQSDVLLNTQKVFGSTLRR